MGLFLQSLKDFILLLTTVVFFWNALKNPYKGIMFYLFCLIVSALTGFARAIYLENILVPVVMYLAMLKSKLVVSSDFIPIFFLLIYIIFISIWHFVMPFPSDSSILFGIVLMFTLPSVFNTPDRVVKYLAVLWLYSFAYSLFVFTHSGNILSAPDVDNRMTEIVSEVSINQGGSAIDPNYLGFSVGVGFFLSVFAYLNIDYLKYIFSSLTPIKKKFFKIFFFIVSILELFLAIRGLSRGVFIALAITLIHLCFTVKRSYRFSIFIMGLGFVCLFAYAGILDKILYRMNDSASDDRFDLFSRVLTSTYSHSGLEGFIFGNGTDFPWQYYGNNPYERKFVKFSPHNSWIRFFIDYGLIGLMILFYVIGKRIKKTYCLIKYDPICSLKMSLFIFLFIVGMSIEPIKEFFGWLVLIACLL